MHVVREVVRLPSHHPQRDDPHRVSAPPADYRWAAAAISIFKRGMKGVYQHCDKAHLHRCLAEFDFRYNNRIALEIDDTQRTVNALAGIGGKRLTYRRPHDARA